MNDFQLIREVVILAGLAHQGTMVFLLFTVCAEIDRRFAADLARSLVPCRFLPVSNCLCAQDVYQIFNAIHHGVSISCDYYILSLKYKVFVS